MNFGIAHKTLLALTIAGLFALGTPAQTAPAPEKKEPRVAVRKENQQKRIAQGVQSGQLTAGETARIESKESKINKEVATDRRANGGNLTNNEKKQINGRQNKVSKQLYKDKHNTPVRQQ